jgi:hypothetical protein
MNVVKIQDMVEIRFKTFHTSNLDEMRTRWVAGQIIDCSSDAWPLVQLSDGQITELRPYMEWRRLDGLAVFPNELR